VKTLNLFRPGGYSVPGGTVWYLAELGEFRGKQELYTRQSSQRLKALRAHGRREHDLECVGRGPGARWIKKG